MIYCILFSLSWIFLIFGVIGIFRFKSIYSRLLTSSKIDTAATLLILIGLIVKVGFNGMAFKLFMIICFIMLTSPVINHVIAKSTYLNGVPIQEYDTND